MKPQTVELKRDLAMRNMRLVTFIEGWEALNKNYQVHSQAEKDGPEAHGSQVLWRGASPVYRIYCMSTTVSRGHAGGFVRHEAVGSTRNVGYIVHPHTHCVNIGASPWEHSKRAFSNGLRCSKIEGSFVY
jgi:hypothetical protein